MIDQTLLILSDSHGSPDHIREAIRRTRPEGILFAGDGLRDLSYVDIPCPLHAVRGNCDVWTTPLPSGEEAEDEMLLSYEGLRLFLCHGHRYGVKSGLTAAMHRAASLGADALIFGHTHLPLETRLLAGETVGGLCLQKPLYVFNPGSVGGGYRSAATFGTLTLRRGVPLFGHGEI